MTAPLYILYFILSLLICACVPTNHWQPTEDRTLTDPLPPQLTISRQSQPSTSASQIEPPDFSNLSIEKAIMLALTHNQELRVEELTPQITATFEQLERGNFDAEIFAESQVGREDSVEPGDDSIIRSDNSNISVGMRKFNPTGTTLELSLSQIRNNDSDDDEEQVARLGLTVTQALLRGFGPAVNLVVVEQAHTQTLASKDQLRGFSETLLAETETAYWNYVLALEEIAIFQASLDVVRKQRKDIESRIEVGILPEIEVAAAKAEEALRIQALLDARSHSEATRLRLISFMTPDPDNYRIKKVIPSSDPRLSPIPLNDLDERLALAEEKRADLREATRLVEVNQLETIVTRNGLLPRLDLFITLGKSGYADSFSDSFRNMSHEGYDLSAGLSLSYKLGNRPAKVQHRAAQLNHQQARMAVQNLRHLAHLDVHMAYNEVEQIRQQIEATRTTRHFQEQSFQAEQERFNVGSSTALLVAQAQRDLLEARIAEIEAIVNYRIALVNLYLAEGSLLERRGVNLN